MNNKLNTKNILVVCASLCVFTCSIASNFMEPSLLLERGPLRMLAEEEDCGFGLRHWTSCYMRDANKAFTSNHGTKTQDIAALFFNGAATPKNESPYQDGFTFRTTQMFENYYVPQTASKYNPLLRTAKLRLSVRYNEWGAIIGHVWDMPVIGKHGRIGLRVNVPLKKVKVSKVDVEGVRMGAETQDVLSVQEKVNPTSGTTTTNVTTSANPRLVLMRMDYAEALRQSSDLNGAVTFNNNNVNGRVALCAAEVQFDTTGALGRFFPNSTNPNTHTGASNNVAVIYSPEGLVPRHDAKNIAFAGTTEISNASKQTATDLMGLKSGEFGVFVAGNNYADLAENEANSVVQRKKMQEAKANLWFAPIVSTSSSSYGTSAGADASGVLETLKTLSDQVTENVYEWFHDKNVDFESFTNEGFGDIDCNFFYSHIFDKVFSGEIFAGFSAPTGGKVKWNKNPYKVNLGSGHWELKVGGLFNWSPGKMFGVRAEGYYAYVNRATEERHATFRNATVKIGPKVDAEVKWDYFVANLDLNIAHFAAKSITGLIGYQLYYKRKDKVEFKNSKLQTWLEQIYNPTTRTFSTHESTLEPLLAEMNTDSIAHRLRFEASFIMSDWLEFFTGGAWTFAGRNMLRSSDLHLGFNIAF